MELNFEHRLTETEERCKSNTHRLADVEKRQDSLDKLVTSVEVLATREAAVESDVKEIKADVKGLTAKPGKRWDSMVDKAVWAIAGAVIVYILGQIGL